MAIGNDRLPTLAPIAGIRLGTVSAGIKTPGRKDLVLIELCAEANCVGVFTQNAFCAAPVIVAKEHLHASAGRPRYLLTNTGNANAGTGNAGIADAKACCAALAKAAADTDPANTDPAQAESILPFSTGVIGEPLPVGLIEAAIPEAITALDADGWAEAASGILTTDTRPKGFSVSFECADRTYTVTGIAKGAGMIRPNMATMLGYLATDAAVDVEILQKILTAAVARSFNRITVDGDTSTNDACVLVATGRAGNAHLDDESDDLFEALSQAVEEVCVQLATGLVRDGEGASKFVTVEVCSGSSEVECLDVAFTIAHSPLVKTALFASDPNWGRLLAAIGRAGIADLDVSRVALYLNGVLIASNGCRAESYTEEQGVAAMTPENIVVRVELNRGTEGASVWTTDFSYDYVRINAEYRT